MNSKQQELLEYWDAFIYEQQEDVSPIAAHIVHRLRGKRLSVLEPACGGGKICIPVAKAGHEVTGFDLSQTMLTFAREKAAALTNLHLLQADMLTSDWGSRYDVVLLAANLMNNIITDWEYKQAQKKLLTQAHKALRPGGLLFIDFDCPDSLAPYAKPGEWLCFEGSDDRETFGRYIVISGTAHDRNRMVRSSRRYELYPKDAEPFVRIQSSEKHIPSLEWMCTQLYRTGFAIDTLHGGYGGEPFDAQHRRCVLWCRRL